MQESDAPQSRRRFDPKSLAVAVASFALLAWVIHRNGGVATIAAVVGRLTYTWPLLFVPTGIAALAIVLTYRACLPNRGRDVPFLTLVHIERSGNALNSFLPLGDSSGNIIKVALLRHWYTSDQIVAAGVWSSMGTGVGNAFAALGPIVAASVGAIRWQVAMPLVAISLLMAVPSMVVLLLVRHGLAARVARLLAKLPFEGVATRRAVILAWAKSLDHHVASAVRDRRADFANVAFWKCAYQFARVFELWVIITLLGLEGGVFAALVYNVMSRAVQQLLPFIPGRMGVSEALAAALFEAIGWPASDGLAMALVLRFTFLVNLAFSSSALSSSHALSKKYPPRSAEEIEAARVPTGSIS